MSCGVTRDPVLFKLKHYSKQMSVSFHVMLRGVAASYKSFNSINWLLNQTTAPIWGLVIATHFREEILALIVSTCKQGRFLSNEVVILHVQSLKTAPCQCASFAVMLLCIPCYDTYALQEGLFSLAVKDSDRSSS